MIEEARVLDLQWGHLFDDVIVNCSMDQCLEQLAMLCDKLRTEPQWVIRDSFKKLFSELRVINL